MATKADFTEEEWESLHKGLTGAGMMVSASDPGFMDSFGEASALAKHLAQREPEQPERARPRGCPRPRNRFRDHELTREGHRRDDGVASLGDRDADREGSRRRRRLPAARRRHRGGRCRGQERRQRQGDSCSRPDQGGARRELRAFQSEARRGKSTQPTTIWRDDMAARSRLRSPRCSSALSSFLRFRWPRRRH